MEQPEASAGEEPDNAGTDVGDGEEPAPSSSRIPPADPAARESGKRFLVATDWEPPLAVSVKDGEVAEQYAPGDLVAKLAEKVTALLKSLGGGLVPMFYGAAPQHSMTLFFGDPHPDGPQSALPMENVIAQAERVADLIDLDGDDLYQRAVTIGQPVERYADLVAFIHTNGVTMRWDVRGSRARELSHDRAHRQYDRLTEDTPTIDRPLTINGVLYRVIAERADDHLGTVGVRLHSWSSTPPGYKRGGKVLAKYIKPEVEEAIRHGLINEAVEVTLLVRTPVPGTSFDPNRRELIVDAVKLGPAESSRLGPRLILEGDDEDGDD